MAYGGGQAVKVWRGDGGPVPDADCTISGGGNYGFGAGKADGANLETDVIISDAPEGIVTRIVQTYVAFVAAQLSRELEIGHVGGGGAGTM